MRARHRQLDLRMLKIPNTSGAAIGAYDFTVDVEMPVRHGIGSAYRQDSRAAACSSVILRNVMAFAGYLCKGNKLLQIKWIDAS